MRAHCGNDPGGREPAVLYYYTWDRDEGKFTRHTIAGPGENIGTGMQICVADLNADGRPDLAIASYKAGKVSVVSSTGKGEALSTKSFSAGSTPISVWAGDVDGDKLVDIVVANELEEGGSVLKNLGDEGFEMLGLCTTDGLACSVRVVNLDGDDLPDLVVANGRANTVGVLWHRPLEPDKPTR